MSKFKGVKTNNVKSVVKAEIREELLTLISSPKVLEVFCGNGEMYRNVWKRADKYTGIDIVKYFDERETICGDARKALKLVELSDYNIYDIDAYGSPYDVLDDIVNGLGHISERVGFCITDGVDMDLKLGRVCKGLRKFIGYNNHIAKRANNLHDEFINLVCRNVAERLGGEIIHFKIATGRTGAKMKYYTLVISPQ